MLEQHCFYKVDHYDCSTSTDVLQAFCCLTRGRFSGFSLVISAPKILITQSNGSRCITARTDDDSEDDDDDDDSDDDDSEEDGNSGSMLKGTGSVFRRLGNVFNLYEIM